VLGGREDGWERGVETNYRRRKEGRVKRAKRSPSKWGSRAPLRRGKSKVGWGGGAHLPPGQKEDFIRKAVHEATLGEGKTMLMGKKKGPISSIGAKKVPTRRREGISGNWVPSTRFLGAVLSDNLSGGR